MNMIKINPDQDLLVFIGDYIDRGDHSREVVDYLVDLKLRLPESIFLLGNHEQMLLEYIDGRNTDAFLYNGGEKTLRSYLGISVSPVSPERITPGCPPPTRTFIDPCGPILNGRTMSLSMPGCATASPWRTRIFSI